MKHSVTSFIAGLDLQLRMNHLAHHLENSQAKHALLKRLVHLTAEPYVELKVCSFHAKEDRTQLPHQQVTERGTECSRRRLTFHADACKLVSTQLRASRCSNQT